MGIGRLRASGSPAGSPGGGRTRISVGSIALQMPKNVFFYTESVGITPKQACLELLTDLVLNYKKVCFKIYSSSFLHFSRLSESLSRRPVYRSTLFGSPHRPVCSFPFLPLWRSLVPPLFHFQLFLDVGQTANQTWLPSGHFLCPKSKNGHNLKPSGIIFEDPLCPTFLGIIGHNSKF